MYTCMSGINFHYFNLREYSVLRLLNFAIFMAKIVKFNTRTIK